MDRATRVWEGEGKAHSSVVPKAVQGTRHHRTLWIVFFYAITIVLVLAGVAKLY